MTATINRNSHTYGHTNGIQTTEQHPNSTLEHSILLATI